MQVRDKLETSIENSYSLDALLKLYKEYFRQFEPNPNVKIETKGVTNSEQKLQKKELSRIFTNIVLSKEKFLELMDLIAPDVRKVFEKIIWNGSKYSPEELEKDIEIKILLREQKNTVNSLFNIICFDKSSGITPGVIEYKLFLPDELRKIVKIYISQPEYYNINPIKNIESTEFLFINNNKIIKDLSIYNNYITTDNITFSKQEKPSATSIRNMKEFCEIEEFYEDNKDKNLESIRTELIITFFKNFKDKEENDNISVLKKALFAMIEGDSFSLDSITSHVKGKSELKLSKEFEVKNISAKKELFSLIKELPIDKWISVQNLVFYCFYRDLDINIFDLENSTNYLYFEELKTGASKYTFTQKTNLKQDNYIDVILNPVVKGFLFLLASVGILDLAYDTPVNHTYRQKNIEYLSPFDGAKYVKLNTFGAYVLEKNNDFVLELNNIEEDAVNLLQIELNHDFLIMNVEGKEKFKTVFIEKIAKKLADNLYQVTEETFLSSCNNYEEVKEKIEKFRNEIDVNLPKIWSDFFWNIYEKRNFIKAIDDVKIYKSEDPILNSILLNEKEVSNLIMKVEGGSFAVQESKIEEFKTALRKFGYLLD